MGSLTSENRRVRRVFFKRRPGKGLCYLYLFYMLKGTIRTRAASTCRDPRQLGYWTLELTGQRLELGYTLPAPSPPSTSVLFARLFACSFWSQHNRTSKQTRNVRTHRPTERRYLVGRIFAKTFKGGPIQVLSCQDLQGREKPPSLGPPFSPPWSARTDGDRDAIPSPAQHAGRSGRETCGTRTRR